MPLKSLFISGTLIVSILADYAQKSFTGKIEFLYYQRDTTKNVYIIKEPYVKLDNYSKKNDGSVEGSFLFNLTTKEIRTISPKRKLWNIHKSEILAVVKGECEVIKTNNTKKILSISCTEYIVKNKAEDTEITYWITDKGNYSFFIPMLQLWNRKDRHSVYFNKISSLPKGSMPLLSIEKSIGTGKIISKLEATKITNEKIKDGVFVIPKDYKKFEE